MNETTKLCSMDGCERKPWAREMCGMHYRRWWRHGDASVVKRAGPAPKGGGPARLWYPFCQRVWEALGPEPEPAIDIADRLELAEGSIPRAVTQIRHRYGADAVRGGPISGYWRADA